MYLRHSRYFLLSPRLPSQDEPQCAAAPFDGHYVRGRRQLSVIGLPLPSL